MKAVYTDAALQDIDDITVWLTAHYPGLGAAVERRLRLVVAHITRWPDSMRPSAHRPGVRVATLGRYPYKIFYRVRGDVVEILHIHHASRAPWDEQT
jgi:plasmid stabilization system protein ParE